MNNVGFSLRFRSGQEQQQHVFQCVCLSEGCLRLRERQRQRDTCRQRQLHMKRQTPLRSSLPSLSWVVIPHCLASSLFLSSSVSVATQEGEVNFGSPSVTVKPLPWVRRRWMGYGVEGEEAFTRASVDHKLFGDFYGGPNKSRAVVSLSFWVTKGQGSSRRMGRLAAAPDVQMLFSFCLYLHSCLLLSISHDCGYQRFKWVQRGRMQ